MLLGDFGVTTESVVAASVKGWSEKQVLVRAGSHQETCCVRFKSFSFSSLVCHSCSSLSRRKPHGGKWPPQCGGI